MDGIMNYVSSRFTTVTKGPRKGYLNAQCNHSQEKSLVVQNPTRKPAEKRYLASIQCIRYDLLVCASKSLEELTISICPMR